MNLDTVYGRQVQLLVRTLPLIDTEKCFALKGGNAINLFYRDLPRLNLEKLGETKHQELYEKLKVVLDMQPAQERR